MIENEYGNELRHRRLIHRIVSVTNDILLISFPLLLEGSLMPCRFYLTIAVIARYWLKSKCINSGRIFLKRE
jgi:hypothetical protein